MARSGEPTWLENDGRALSAIVHASDDSSTAGVVVIAPPLGREGVVTFRALKALAHKLAGEGFTAIRFSWSGEGDSAAFPSDLGPIASWRQDLDAVLTFAEQLAPGGKPSLVAVRLAACLAAEIDPARLGQRVLWEPINGRKYLRYHSTLRRVSLAEPVIGTGVELDGSWHSDADAAEIKALRFTEESSVVITEPTPEALTAFVEAESRHTVVPWASIDHILASLPRGRHATTAFTPTTECTMRTARGQIVEELVNAGELELSAVLTYPVDTPVAAVMVTFPAGSEPRTGPSSLWVTAARELAGEGVASLRVDRVGQGEMMLPDASVPPNPYTALAIDEGASAIDHVRRLFPDAKLMLVGLCNGAWVAGLAASTHPVDRVVAFNNIAWKADHKHYKYLDPRPSAAESQTGPATASPGGLGERLLRWRLKVYETAPYRLARKGRDKVMRSIPHQFWVAATSVSRLEYPGALVTEPSPIRYDFHFGADDAAYFERCKGPAAFSSLRKRGVRIEHHYWETLDHALVGEGSRRRALEILRDTVADLTGPA